MKQDTIIALLGSIAKWEAIVEGAGRDHYASNCPLCQLFELEHDARIADFDGDPDDLDEAFPFGSCTGCPVAESTSQDGCGSTPYIAWTRHHGKVHGTPGTLAPGLGLVEGCAECLELAQAELDFLKSLLPTGAA